MYGDPVYVGVLLNFSCQGLTTGKIEQGHGWTSLMARPFYFKVFRKVPIINGCGLEIL